MRKILLAITFLYSISTSVSAQTFTLEQNLTGNNLSNLRGQSFTPNIQGSGTGSTGGGNTVYLKSFEVVYSYNSTSEAAILYIYSASPTSVSNLDGGTDGTLVGFSKSKSGNNFPFTTYNFDSLQLDKTKKYYALFRENVSLELGITSYAGGDMIKNTSGNLEATSGIDLKMKATFAIAPTADIELKDGLSILNTNGTLHLGSAYHVFKKYTRELKIENTGMGTLTLNAPEITGTGFSIIQNPEISIGPGKSTTIVIGLTSNTPAQLNGKLTIESNDPDESPFVLNLLCHFSENLNKTTVTPISYSKKLIQIYWQDNSADETFYSIERSEDPVDNFIEIKRTAANQTAFEDTTIIKDKTYYYRLRSGDANRFSVYSSTVEAKAENQMVGDWEQKASFPSDIERYRAKAVGFSIGNKGYVGLGAFPMNIMHKDLWEYDAGTNSWLRKKDFPGEARYGAVSFVIDNKAYIGLGKYLNLSNQEFKLKNFYQYDPGTDTWTAIADFPGEARYNASAFTIDGKGYVGLGYGANALKDFYEYNPATNSWRQMTDFAETNSNCPAFSIDGLGYVTGTSKTFYAFDPTSGATGTWTKKADIPSLAYDGTSFVLNGKGYIVTGGNNKFTQVYNPQNNTWEQKNIFAGFANRETVGFAIENKGYVATGASNGCTDELWEYHLISPKVMYFNAMPSRGKVVLSWESIGDGETGYIIEKIKNSSLPYIKVAELAPNQLSYTDTISDKSSYSYRIRVKYANGESVNTYKSIQTYFPNGLRGEVLAKNARKLTWQQAWMYSYYIIERAISTDLTGEQNYDVLDTISGSQYIDSTMIGEVWATYRIKGFDSYQMSLYSDSVSLLNIHSPGQLTALARENAHVELLWIDNSAKEVKYVVQRKDNGWGYFTIDTLPSNSTTYLDKTAYSNEVHYYRIAAVANNQFSYSNEVEVTTTYILEAPSALTAKALNNGKIELIWKDNTQNEIHYKIERKTITDTDFSVLDSTVADVVQYLDTNVVAMTKYIYRVQAINHPSFSVYSNVIEVVAGIDIATGVENPLSLNTTVSPNPTHGIVTIDVKDRKAICKLIKIVGADGRVHDIPKSDEANGIKMDFSAKPNGLYLIIFETGTIKILKN